MLSRAAASLWGKSGVDDFGVVTSWLPLAQHLRDSADTAAHLWDSWLSENVRQQIIAGLGGEPATARSTAVFLAAAHDVGKASPAFASQVPVLAAALQPLGLTFPVLVTPGDRALVPHSVAGHVALMEWLSVQHGWRDDPARSLAVVVGGHHGVQPTTSSVQLVRARPALFGTGAWAEARRELLDEMSRISGFDTYASEGEFQASQQAQVLLTGFVIVADWIASSTQLFPTFPLGRFESPNRRNDDRAAHALRDLGLPAPWAPRPRDRSQGTDAMLAERFDLPQGAAARPVQAAAVEAASAMDGPGLLVIEAPTGEGKTEAALLAAEVLAARSGAGGVFVALPTQATSDAMFTRVLSWLARLPDAVVDDDAIHAVALLHGKSGLNRALRDLSAVPVPESVSDEHGASAEDRSGQAVRATVHPWFTGRKRAVLAEFSVGTIDQLLFASLKARHLTLRHLGLAGKVVVLDEVHAVDIYMDTYLLRAIEWCGAYGVPVVALSATLPRAHRERLHAAYATGRATQLQGSPVLDASPFGRRRRRAAAAADSTQPPAGAALEVAHLYPVVTSSTDGHVRATPVAPSTRSVEVVVETLDDSPESLAGLLRSRLADGGCALIVRNTVSRAITTFDALRDEFGADVTLMHSRFISLHRSANDEWLRNSFGPPSLGAAQRPRRSIVVATQVVEQSLDIDLDLLVTDLAPMDLLVQRMGRVHRHDRGATGRPVALRVPRCVVVGVDDWSAAPPRAVQGSRMVYDEHLLLRTAAMLRGEHGRQTTVRSPEDVAPLVQSTYGTEPLGPERWQPDMATARVASERRAAGARRRASTFLLDPPRPDGQPIVGWIDGGAGEADEDGTGRAQVRDSEDSAEVILLRRAGSYLAFVDDVAEGAQTFVAEARHPRETVERIAASTVRIPGYHSHHPGWDALVDALAETYFDEWQRDPLLRGQLVLLLDDDQTASVAGFTFRYSRSRGLEITSPSARSTQSTHHRRQVS